MLGAFEFTMPASDLRDAVPGLAGILGFLAVPTATAWIRLLASLVEQTSGLRRGLAYHPGSTAFRVPKAVAWSFVWLFFAFTLVRAAGKLREIQSEAPVLGASITGFATGAALWFVYAVGVSMLWSGRAHAGRGRHL